MDFPTSEEGTKVKVDTQLIRERKAPSTFIREDMLQFIPFKFLHTDSLIHLKFSNVPTKYQPSIMKGICQVPTSNPYNSILSLESRN